MDELEAEERALSNRARLLSGASVFYHLRALMEWKMKQASVDGMRMELVYVLARVTSGRRRPTRS